jgi:hypothetical protein
MKLRGLQVELTPAHLVKCRQLQGAYVLDDILSLSFPKCHTTTGNFLLQFNPQLSPHLNITSHDSLFMSPLDDALQIVDALLDSEVMSESELKELVGSPKKSMFNAYDVIKLRYNCDSATAVEKFQELQRARPDFKFGKYKFPAVYEPIVSFTQILDAWGYIPVPEQLDGLEFANASETFARPMPVDFTFEDLAAVCRNADGMLSLFDLISYRDNAVKTGKGVWNRWQGKPQGVLQKRFDSEAHPTWVCTFEQVAWFMANAPGRGQQRFRAAEKASDPPASDTPDSGEPGAIQSTVEEDVKQTEEATHMDMDQAVQDHAEWTRVVKQTVDNPVQALPLMNITEEVLLNSNCRVTPDGRFSLYDALARRDGTNTHVARCRFSRWFEAENQPSVSDGSLETACADVTKHVFPSEARETPVAPFHVIMRLLAVIPGPGVASVRAQQADLTTRAMAGDVDLELAINERRSALPAAAQEVMMTGLASSSEAKRMREEQAELERPEPKRQRMTYSREQLVALARSVYPSVAPEPCILEMLYSEAANLRELKEMYVEFYKPQLDIMEFERTQRRLDLQAEADIKNKEEERRLMSFRATEELKIQEKHSNDDIQVKLQHSAQEIQIKREEAAVNIKLKEQEIAKAKREDEAAQQKLQRVAKRGLSINDSDLDRVMIRKFTDTMCAMCDVGGCLDHVVAMHCAILEKPGYIAGDIDKLLVVCKAHTDNHHHTEIIHTINVKDSKCDLWLFTVGLSSHTICWLCCQRQLYIWQTDAEESHVEASAHGGTGALANMVIGCHSCNKKQGTQHLTVYNRRNRCQPKPRDIVVPQEKLVEVRKELKCRSQKKANLSPLARVEKILKAAHGPKYTQPRLK